MSTTARTLTFILLLVISIPCFAITLECQWTGITVHGATPNGSVAIVGYARDWVPDSNVETRVEIDKVLTADGDGNAHYQNDHALWQIIWLAVDCKSREWTIDSPWPFRVHQLEMKPPVDPFTPGRDSLLIPDVPYAVVFVIRPEGGRWRATVTRGTPSDENPRSATARKLSFRKMIGDTPAPATVTPNDVILVVNDAYMSWWATQVVAHE
jgi:hypothetical protein